MQLKDNDDPLVDNFRRSFGYELGVFVCFFFAIPLWKHLPYYFEINWSAIDSICRQEETQELDSTKKTYTGSFLKTNFPDTCLLSVLILVVFFHSLSLDPFFPFFSSLLSFKRDKLSQLIKSNQMKLVDCLFTTSAKWEIHWIFSES